MIKPSISITIPIYNEVEQIEKVVLKLISDLKKITLNFEIILVENGSTDASAIISDQLSKKNQNVKTLHMTEANYGNAVKKGYLTSTKDILVNFSADWIDLNFLKKALTEIQQYSIIVATKNSHLSLDQRPFLRKTGGLLYSKIIRFLFGFHITDTHGIKVARKKDVINIIKNCKFGGEEFDTEFILKATSASLKILEIPVVIKEIRPSRKNVLVRAFRGIYQLMLLKLLAN